jgi:hypothetical protein
LSGIVFCGPLVWSFGHDGVVGSVPEEVLTQAYFGWLWVFPLVQSGDLKDATPDPAEYAVFQQSAAKLGCERLTLLRCKQAGDFQYYIAEASIRGVPGLVAGALDEVQAAPTNAPANRIPIEYIMIGSLMNR